MDDGVSILERLGHSTDQSEGSLRCRVDGDEPEGPFGLGSRV